MNESSLADNTLAVSILCHSIRLGALQYLPDSGGFKMAVSGLVGSHYSFWVSTDLADWQKLSDFACTNNPTWVVDPAVAKSVSRFYRVTAAP